MAGHSHWAKVKRYKVVTDARKGKLFSKLSREITMAAKMGGGDPGFNPRLRTAVEAARSESMPADKIENAINKGTGKIEGVTFEEMMYEGYAPGGVALLVEVATDNKNRTAAEMRSLFTKSGGNMSGSVAWMFKKVAWFLVENSSEDAVLEATLEAGADDVKVADDNTIEVTAPVDKFDALEKALKAASIKITESKITYIPTNPAPITDEAAAQKVLSLIEALDDHDDVQNVYPHCDISSEIIEKLGK
ncbi:MAG: YebC/PmpR family DNA-binding transcriptional regulator [Verrucomicrobiota bacterium]